jgi:hypothetical protein
MDTAESQQLPEIPRPRRVREGMYPSSVLGWRGGVTAINSLAPFAGHFFSGNLPLPAAGVSLELEWDWVSAESQLPPVEARQSISENSVSGFDIVIRAGDGRHLVVEAKGQVSERPLELDRCRYYQGLWHEDLPDIADRGASIVERPDIDIGPGVATYARSVGAERDTSFAADLCMRHVPGARRVTVTLNHDPEDRSTGLHLRVWTTATIEDVLAAEDELHREFFDRTPVDLRGIFSFGYEFVR